MQERSTTLLPNATIHRPHVEKGVEPMSIVEEAQRGQMSLIEEAQRAAKEAERQSTKRVKQHD